MTVGFIVLAHDDPVMLDLLLESVDGMPTFVHLDKDARRRGLHAELRPREHVLVSPESVCVHWAGFSMLRAMMETLDYALQNGADDLSHIAFLSGHCYPVRHPKDFEGFLDQTPQPVHCRAFALAQGPTRQLNEWRVKRRHWLDGAVGHVNERLPEGVARRFRQVLLVATLAMRVDLPRITHACGSAWTAIPPGLAHELVEHYRRGGFDYLRHAVSPDEIAIPSYVYNGAWASKTQRGCLDPPVDGPVTPNFHWLRRADYRRPMDENDVEAAQKSGHFFARKVTSQQRGVIDRLREGWS
jgi:hypothetical protein